MSNKESAARINKLSDLIRSEKFEVLVQDGFNQGKIRTQEFSAAAKVDPKKILEPCTV